MHSFLHSVKPNINPKVYSKDPFSSELGKKIITESIVMIDEVGLESFTFKKLANRLETTESSLYRYFENKHKLLIYLTSWYWALMEYRLLYTTANLPIHEKIHASVKIICTPLSEEIIEGEVSLQKLLNIVIAESPKAFLTKDVDIENKEGYFTGFKRFSGLLGDIIKIVSPNYEYPYSLASVVIESAHYQRFYAAHLPKLCDARQESQLIQFLTDLINKNIQ